MKHVEHKAGLENLDEHVALTENDDGLMQSPGGMGSNSDGTPTVATEITTAIVEHVPIDRIVIGPRRRERLGPITALAASIAAVGLLHPIVVRNGTELVAGHRRLAACKSLGWSTIPVRRVEHMSDEEYRAIELDENVERHALNDYEQSKRRLAALETEAAALAEKGTKEVSPTVGKTSKPSKRGRQGEGGGRPIKGKASRAAVATATGISKTAQVRIENHVRFAEQYPFLQGPAWTQSTVLRAGALLEQLPADERARVVARIETANSAAPVTPKAVMAILQSELADVANAAVVEEVPSPSSAKRLGAKPLRAADPVSDILLALTAAADRLRKLNPSPEVLHAFDRKRRNDWRSQLQDVMRGVGDFDERLAKIALAEGT